MLFSIPGLLAQPQLDKVHEVLKGAPFVDGRLTAGFAAARVKNNLEMRPEPDRMRLLIRIIMASLGHNETFRFAALPHRVADPIFARYEPGMTYGDHVDDPIMGTTGPRFRTDVSMTVFLNAPETYDGGELVVRTPFGGGRGRLPLFQPPSCRPGHAGRASGRPDVDTELCERPGPARAPLRAQSRP
jgi:PKHD-type hydroxylase